MALPLSNGEGQNRDNIIMKGVYANEVAIVDITDLSGQDQNGKTFDLAIEIQYRDGDRTSKKWLSGNFKREGEVVTGWGKAFLIENFCQIAGIYNQFGKEELAECVSQMEKGKFPEAFKRALRDKKLFKCSYVVGKEEGKLQYRTWDHFASTKELMKSKFDKAVNSAYPPYQYNPSVMDQVNLPVSGAAHDPITASGMNAPAVGVDTAVAAELEKWV